jgi:YesN/AraC family two-component response regulator
MEVKKNLSKAYLSNLHVNLIVADYIKCDNTWKEDGCKIDFNKFYYICDGDGWIQSGDKCFFPKKGDLVLIPANRKHAYSYVNDNYYEKYWCHFTATIGNKNLFEIFDFPNVINITEGHNWLINAFDRLIEYDRQQEVSSILKAKAVLLEIISFFLEKTKAKELNIFKSPAIEKLELLITYIHDNIDQPITVNQLADIVHLQENYFIRFFRSHFGNTPMNYVKTQRFEKAKEYLVSSDFSISYIGTLVGYTDVGNFSKQFKNYSGMTPSNYRKQRKN